MEVSKPVPSDLSQSKIVCKFNNLNGAPMENLVFQVLQLFTSYKSLIAHTISTAPHIWHPPLHFFSHPAHLVSSSLHLLTLPQAAVPKYLRLEMLPPSSTTIPAQSQGAVTQEIKIFNSMQGQKTIMLKLKIAYRQGADSVRTH
jgi:hypothetical protein